MVAALGPVEIDSQHRPSSSTEAAAVDIDAERVCQKNVTCIGEPNAADIATDPTTFDERVMDLHAETTSDVVVAAAGSAQIAPRCRPTGLRCFRQVELIHPFEEFSDVTRRDSVGAIAASGLHSDQPGVDEFAEVAAHRRRSDPAGAGEFAAGVSGTRQQGTDHRCAGRVTEC